ncbi:MAG: helix-turn-helix transcriptional regulator [Aeriscardovia sp.]|nr:helix-turn-helix transcriptional regulator [Aeriscardovia sp.]
MKSDQQFKILLGQWLADQRIKNGKTQEEVAKHLGVTKQSVHYYENGINMMSAKAFMHYCAYVGADPDKFVALYKKTLPKGDKEGSF